MAKYKDVYDNVKYLTPMARMLKEQAARQKILDEQKQKEEEDGKPKSTSRKPRANTGTDK